MLDFLTGITAGGYSLFGYIIPFLVVVTIVVFFHELGHYLVARWNKVDIEAFSIGFGPELIGLNDRSGTRWKLCAVPLGGYVKFVGDANAASVADHERVQHMTDEERAGSFEHKRVGQRAAIVAAGPIANFILAIIIFAGSFYFLGRYETDPVITEIVADSAAEAANLQTGDIIREIDGTEVESFSDIPRLVAPNHGLEMVFTVERSGRLVEIPITPRLTEREDRFGNKNKIGIVGIISKPRQEDIRKRNYSLVQAIASGADQTWYIVTRTFQYLGGIFIGRESLEQLRGPVGIAEVTGQVATLGISALLNLAAVLSVSIGLLNLFPIPILDGGHLVFYAYEAVFGKPVSAAAQEMGFRIGFMLLIALMIFATHNDIVRVLYG